MNPFAQFLLREGFRLQDPNTNVYVKLFLLQKYHAWEDLAHYWLTCVSWSAGEEDRVVGKLFIPKGGLFDDRVVRAEMAKLGMMLRRPNDQ
jgi:hypothetical protein